MIARQIYESSTRQNVYIFLDDLKKNFSVLISCFIMVNYIVNEFYMFVKLLTSSFSLR